MKQKLTLKTVKAELILLGINITKQGGEYRVRLPLASYSNTEAAAGPGYFTPDLQDALDTGKAMAKERASGPGAALRHHATGAIERGEAVAITEQRETFAQYLVRVGQDQADAGRVCTAEDYANASARIEELENLLGDFAKHEGHPLFTKPGRPADGTVQAFSYSVPAEIVKRARTILANKYQHLN